MNTDIYPCWYKAVDALLAFDHALGQQPGAADQSFNVSKLIRIFRDEIGRELAAIQASDVSET